MRARANELAILADAAEVHVQLLAHHHGRQPTLESYYIVKDALLYLGQLITEQERAAAQADLLAIQDAAQLLAMQDAAQLLAIQDAAQLLAIQDAAQLLAIQDAAQLLTIQDDEDDASLRQLEERMRCLGYACNCTH